MFWSGVHVLQMHLSTSPLAGFVFHYLIYNPSLCVLYFFKLHTYHIHHLQLLNLLVPSNLSFEKHFRLVWLVCITGVVYALS